MRPLAVCVSNQRRLLVKCRGSFRSSFCIAASGKRVTENVALGLARRVDVAGLSTWDGSVDGHGEHYFLQNFISHYLRISQTFLSIYTFEYYVFKNE